MPKIIMVYMPYGGYAVPDGMLEEEFCRIMYAKKILEEDEVDYAITSNYSTENIFDYFRLMIARGRLNHEDIAFQMEGSEDLILINEYAMIPDWPKDFLSLHGDMCEELLEFGMTKHEAKSRAANEKRREAWALLEKKLEKEYYQLGGE